MFQRYSSPMILLEQMIRTGRLFEFITELVQIRNEELDEKAQWEFWLHKDFERSFAEFRDSINNSQETETVSEKELIAVVQNSKDITSSFVPQD